VREHDDVAYAPRVNLRGRPLALVLAMIATACRPPAQPCAWPVAGVTVVRDGAATLVRRDLEDTGALFTPSLPTDDTYRAFRARVRADGAELRRPTADRAPPADDAERELWRREDLNAELVLAGEAGQLRPIRCLEALTFHRARESIVLVLRRDARTRIYVGASDQMFPPKSVYGLDQARADVAAGWRLDVVLHNHTVQRRGDRVALGVPTLSTGDVSLLRNVATDPGLGEAWVTNGVYTAVVPATDFRRFLGRD